MSLTSPLVETRVAVLTPPGAGAIATLAVCGPQAWEKVRELVRPRPQARSEFPTEAETGRIWLGRCGEGATDEVVVTVTRTTPMPWVELHCHGGPEVVRLLVETFAAHGVCVCTWKDLQRTLPGDPYAAAALSALVEARTARTAAILLDQYQGAFGQALPALLEAWDRGDLGESGRQLESLARWSSLGRHLTTAWRVVIAGAPNVGKSSLVNALAGYSRCVVAATPGTTRDVVTTLIAVDGWPVELADTAGLREATDNVDQLGMDLARRAAQAADRCLWVLDASVAPVWPGSDLSPVQYVINKMDLAAAWDLDQAVGAMRISARSGMGLAELCQELARSLVPEPPPSGAAVPFLPYLCTQMETAWRLYAEGKYADSRRVLASLEVSDPAKPH
jgi:tRNA modification GTPase